MNSRALGVAAVLLFFSALFFPVLKIGNMGFSPVHISMHWGEFSSETSGQDVGAQYILAGTILLYLALATGLLALFYDYKRNVRGMYGVVVLVALASIMIYGIGYVNYAETMDRMMKSQGWEALAGIFYALIGPGEAILLEALATAAAGAALATSTKTCEA